jgi:hypothetical protein
LRRVLDVLASRAANNDTLNALAMILSRRKEAPHALTADLVDKIVAIVSEELVRLTAILSFQIRFKNALSAIAGLFRYREVEPYALLAGRDPAAHKLRNKLDEVDTLLVRHQRRVPLYEEKSALLASVRDYLDGAGDPNILIRIESLNEGEDEDRE